MDEKSVKRNIRRTREALGLSQRQMAEQLGISRTAYRNFETGETRIYSEHITQMAGMAGKTDEEVLLGDEARAAASELRESVDWEARMRALTAEYERRLEDLRREIKHLKALLESKEQSIRLQEQLLGMYARKSQEND
ncbi:MAG: helix-turn-helix domain-containing protein [Bacteroidales bacterium]|nr:helix-turn-helix domain-containing protein [Bacteroidales bacterium]